ncbi:hypothetical protein [Tenggerimyces flavus]|uniref:Major facilitator superfamily (MFS) profile domain-containing protein n=1 Tax=Tenggerimyces flavus TaxID=1708749 RepID=A0ABV7Y9K4_9ACTN|nr:hypothetical protein [Tenggerimyces flavus]MBM7788840.1 hypothetical protein [Tenggerimyces flavus]
MRHAAIPAALTVVSGVAIFAGSLLPWATIGEFGGMSGVGGYGTITLALGAAVVACAVGVFLGYPVLRWVALGCAVLAGLVALVTLFQVVSVALAGIGAPGIGLFVVIGGAILGTVGAATVRTSAPNLGQHGTAG